MTIGLVALVVLIAISMVVLLGFVGCAENSWYTVDNWITLHYSPKLMIDGAPVDVQRVDFVLRNGDEILIRLSAADRPRKFKNGIEELFDSYGEADPTNGLYRAFAGLSVSHHFTVKFGCTAFKDPAGSPTYETSQLVERDIPLGGEVRVVFTLTQDGGRWVISPES